VTDFEGANTHAQVTALVTLTPPRLDLATLYQAHGRQVWRTVARLGVPFEGVEDVVQEVFLIAHGRSNFAAHSSPLTYLLGIAIKLAANARRTSRRRVAIAVPDSLPDGARGVDEELDRRRLLTELDRTLSILPDEQREVLVLCDLESLSAPEVSAVLGVKLNTVYSRLRLARAALLRHLGKEARS